MARNTQVRLAGSHSDDEDAYDAVNRFDPVIDYAWTTIDSVATPSVRRGR